MSLIPRDSWSDFYRLFDNAFPALRPRFDADTFSPRVDVIEKETAFESSPIYREWQKMTSPSPAAMVR